MKKSVSAGGVVLRNGFVAVVNQNHDSWSLPKGHVDKGEILLETAKREIYEETGLKNIIFVKKLGEYTRERINDSSKIKNIHLFLFHTDQKELKPIDNMNPEAKWVSKDKVADLLTANKDKEFYLSILDEIE